MRWKQLEKDLKKRIRGLDFGDYNTLFRTEYRLLCLSIIKASEGDGKVYTDSAPYSMAMRLIEFLGEMT